MAKGPGKYDNICTTAREAAQADSVVLIVLNGVHGSGFSVQSSARLDQHSLADLLEIVVNAMREGQGR
jgi:hypothetical protein